MNCPSGPSGTLCALMCPTERQIHALWRFTSFFFDPRLLKKKTHKNFFYQMITQLLLIRFHRDACCLNRHVPQQPGSGHQARPACSRLHYLNQSCIFFIFFLSPIPGSAEQGCDERQLCDAKRGHQQTENIKPQKSSFQEDRRRGDMLHSGWRRGWG